MGNPENNRAERCCPECAGLGARGSGSASREECALISREKPACQRPTGPVCENYLQIPTFLRWGRRLSY
jgi:hypothetical protein